MEEITFEECSFEECLRRDPSLDATRREYAAKSAEQRRKAADFLIDEQDFTAARDLYAAAENAHPEVAMHSIGLCYCLGKLGRHEDAVGKARRALELEPDDCYHLNDLGRSLFEAGHLDEAEATLRRSIGAAADDYDLPETNLGIVLAEKAKLGPP